MGAPVTPLLEAVDVVKAYAVGSWLRPGRLVAVDRVSVAVEEGETLAVVGESGSGKSTLARCLTLLEPPTSGTVRLRGQDVTHARGAALRAVRRQIQMVFQDPYGSLNPRKRVLDIVADPLRAQGVPRREARGRAEALLAEMGLRPEQMHRRPREFSGGQRQRIGIARALAPRPSLVVADEPVSALDVSVQAQIVNLMADLQAAHGLTYVVIAHDLGLVRQIASRVAVMYLGRIVETAPAEALYAAPRHPYTAALLSAVPIPDPTVRRAREPLLGEPPSPMDPPAGCRFHTRCARATERCRVEPPALRPLGPSLAACHHPLDSIPEAA